MENRVIETLIASRAYVKERWAVLLNGEPIRTPLGQPQLMVRLIDSSFEEILSALRDHRIPISQVSPRKCSNVNPYVPYYSAGKQALLEVIILHQAQHPTITLTDCSRMTEVLRQAIDAVIGEEVLAFEAVCQRQAN